MIARVTPSLRSAIKTPAAAMLLSRPQQVRTVTNLAKTLYTAKGQATGQGRNGVASLLGGEKFELSLAMPKDLGGSGDGQNPEQLFALGYAACFLSALNLVARQSNLKLPPKLTCEAHVSIGPPAEGEKPFALAVDLVVRPNNDGADKAKIEEAVHKAHEVCPYSNATRNNVPVKLSIE